MSEPLVRSLAEALPIADIVIVRSASELVAAAKEEGSVSVIDGDNLPNIDAAPCPIIAIAEDVPTTIGWLAARPWLAHAMSSSALASSHLDEHITQLVAALTKRKGPRLLDWVGKAAGRRVRLVQASRRAERLDKLTEFYESKGVTLRTIQVLRDAAEELLTNAFYDAPVAAGVVGEPIPRTRDVILPDEHACDLAYGAREDVAFVRVRDPFGSLRRSRLIEVLSRCARSDMQVEVDETMGGAGLGLWRIFSGATVVAISVVDGRSTEILVEMWKRAGTGPRPFSFHLFFEKGKRSRAWTVDHDSSSVTTQVTLAAENEP